jgi:hypothetical protein
MIDGPAQTEAPHRIVQRAFTRALTTDRLLRLALHGGCLLLSRLCRRRRRPEAVITGMSESTTALHAAPSYRT